MCGVVLMILSIEQQQDDVIKEFLPCKQRTYCCRGVLPYIMLQIVHKRNFKFLSIISKQLQDAGLRDMCVESGVTADRSVAGIMEGHKYNHVVRVHKLVYEALMRLAWKGFLPWIEDNHADVPHLAETLNHRPLSKHCQPDVPPRGSWK
uniref:Uncharacterized protein n=1 Tax=Octopus bimaculoides TaxID=37653 RepID=A0A0L8HF21_OCTBM